LPQNKEHTKPKYNIHNSGRLPDRWTPSCWSPIVMSYYVLKLNIENKGRCCGMVVGHGPFSHMFDGKFIPAVQPGSTWKVCGNIAVTPPLWHSASGIWRLWLELLHAVTSTTVVHDDMHTQMSSSYRW